MESKDFFPRILAAAETMASCEVRKRHRMMWQEVARGTFFLIVGVLVNLMAGSRFWLPTLVLILWGSGSIAYALSDLVWLIRRRWHKDGE